MRYRSLPFAIFTAIALAAAPLMGQEAEHRSQEPGAQLAHKQLGPADVIMPHITDSKHLELPCWKGMAEWACEVTLPTWNVNLGGRVIDFGPTKHVVFLFLAALLVALVVILAARAHVRSTQTIGRPRGFAAGLEAVILYLRFEVLLPVLGGHGGQ